MILACDADPGFKSSTPRWLHPLLGRPLIRWAIELAQAAGCEPVVVVVTARHREVLAHALQGLAQVVVTTSASFARSVGAGLQVMGPGVDEVLLLHGDMPLGVLEQIQALRALRRRCQAAVAMLLSPVLAESGVEAVERDGEQVTAVTKLRQGEPRAVDSDAGLWLAQRSVLTRLATARSSRSPLGQVLASSTPQRVCGYAVPVSHALHVEDRMSLAFASRLLRARINQQHMLAGVGFEDPTSTLVEPEVVLEPDVQLGANVQLLGRTRVQRGARVDSSSVVIDSSIAASAHIRSFCHLEGATVREAAIVGPYARLRPLADIGEGAHIGNFVEVKKTVVEAGAKANHLAYLGDARVGRKANIGAGTITCNYDGVGKNHTDIGAGVFVGSNATLVAPIKLEDGAYVAAGSTLSQDVPADALAFGRARQENKPGVAAKLRARMQARAKKK